MAAEFPMTMRRFAEVGVEDHQRIHFTCADHGEIHTAEVFCSHDAEYEMKAVTEAHRKPYGANCAAVINVELKDA